MSSKRAPVSTWATENAPDPSHKPTKAPKPPRSPRRRAPKATAPRPAADRRTLGVKARTGTLVAVGLIAIASVSALLYRGMSQDNDVSPTAAARTDTSSPAAEPTTTAVPTTTSVALSPLGCTETDTPERAESSGPGNINSPSGVIVAYEHAFFVNRDARAMVDLTVPSAEVASEGQLAAAIGDLAPNTPWCVTVTPTETPDEWRTEIRFLDGTVTTWTQATTVTKLPDGTWRILKVRPQ